MGELNLHALNLYDCNTFIETGTGKGTGLEYACRFPFKILHTIEIIPELYEFSKNKFSDPRITFHLGHSVKILEELLPTVPKEDSILFWMDAHFPGVDFGLGSGKYIYDDENIPSKQELEVIKHHRTGCNDVIILDDLRLYEDGPYQLENIDIGKPKSGIGFIENIFSSTHFFRRDFRHQGFLILIPKKGAPL
jgi:hypothetical protein